MEVDLTQTSLSIKLFRSQMQIARFNEFVSEVTTDIASKPHIQKIEVFRFFESKWFDERSTHITDEKLCALLDKTVRHKSHWRQKSSCTTYFPVPDLQATVVVTFNQPPIKTTQAAVASQIQKSLQHSTDRYDANHDALTGLLNKAALDDALSRGITEATEVSSSREGHSGVIQSTVTVALISVDIDHFKQVNDTFGHLYGDVVLKCFSRRLEKRLTDFHLNHPNIHIAALARPGGEEFSALLVGTLSNLDIVEIAERLREEITNDALPSDEEWKDLEHSDEIYGLSLPHVSNRRITSSFGIAVLRSPSLKIPTRQLIEQLHTQSDLALYSAKSGGRDCVRHFDDILSRYGRVLEQHIDTQIVVIDIGRQVGVKIGQEFIVYHPDFTGNKPFLYSDGRTTKQLGVYPKLALGRVAVFDVQQDIAFAKLLSGSEGRAIPPSSELEAVPLGTISHLITGPSSFLGGLTTGSPLLSPDDFRVSVDRLVDQGRRPFVAVAQLINPAALEESRGVAFLNNVLAQLYQSIEKTLGQEAKICQLGPTSLAALVDEGSLHEPPFTLMRAIREDVHNKARNLVEFAIGAFSQEHLENNSIKGDASKIDARSALDFAMYAASIATNEESGITFYSAFIADEIIQRSREIDDISAALRDYQDMVSKGVRFSSLENKVGLAVYEGAGDLNFAVEAFQRAIELQPDYGIFHANLGLAEFDRENYSRAYDAFRMAQQVEHGFALDGYYREAEAMAGYKKYKSAPNEDLRVELLGLFERIRTEENDNAKLKKLDAWIAELKS